MYTGSFAAYLKGIACARGFVIFTRVPVNRHIPPFTGEGLSLFSFTGLYMLRFRLIWECQPVSPTAGEQRFDSVTQHNHLLCLAFYSLNPPPLLPALDAMVRHDIAKSSG